MPGTRLSFKGNTLSRHSLLVHLYDTIAKGRGNLLQGLLVCFTAGT